MQTDRELIEAMRAGNRSAADEIARRYARWLVDYADRAGAGEHDAEDVAQSVLRYLIERPPIGLTARTLHPYLMKVARAEIARGASPVRHLDLDDCDVADPGTSPSAAAARRLVVARAADKIAAMKTGHRRLLELRFGEGLEPTEIAELVHQPPGSVRKLLSRLLSRLGADFL